METLLSLDTRLWISSFLNVVALAFGLWSIVKAGNVKGQSPYMYAIFLFMQITFAEAGYRNQLWGQFWGMAASAVITVIVLILLFVWRKR